MTEAEEIAARYGVTCRPGLTVTKVPTGASGLPEMRWNGTGLAYVDPAHSRAMFSGWRKPAPKPDNPSRYDIAAARRVIVAELAMAGKSRAEIAAATGSPRKMINRDLEVLALSMPRVLSKSEKSAMIRKAVEETMHLPIPEAMKICGIGRTALFERRRQVLGAK